jgi:heavy metal translocating P-type ATPase
MEDRTQGKTSLRWSRDSYIAAAVLTMIVAHLLLRFVFHWDQQHAAIPLFVGLAAGTPLVIELLRKLLHFQFGSDLIAGISIVSAVFLREYLVACVVILMLSGGQALETYATRRASSVLQALARRMPAQAHLVEGGSFRNIGAEQLKPGDLFMVLPHEICPVDGEVVEGHGRMDESFLTGEPFELSKAPGSRVISGAVNGEAVLKVRALRLAADSRYARILRVLRETEQNQPQMRRIADRLGAWYTPLALVIAAAGWMVSGSPQRFLAVSVIATPCPLLLAIPVAILGGISLAARRGIVVRNATVLEQIDSCRTFIFDKTGTLTYGHPALTRIDCTPGHCEDQILSLAASLESYSRHPLAKGVLEAARKKNITITPPANVTEHPGDGLRGTVSGHRVHITGRKQGEAAYGTLMQVMAPKSGLECVLYIDDRFAASLSFQDELKRDSSSFIGHLSPKHHARNVVLLSGDKETEVRHVASLVGIRTILYGKSPEEKLAFVRDETRQAKTLFVGDGINDAPAMVAATVGVALGGASDALSESADAVVLDSSLTKIDELIHIGRRMRKIALQSAAGGIILSAAGMVVAATGHLPPLNGAIAQEFIDLAAVLNALRVAFGVRPLADF